MTHKKRTSPAQTIQPIQQSPSEIKSKKYSSWLIIIGSVIIFGSWIVENYLQKEFEAKGSASDYDRTFLVSVRTNSIVLEFQTQYFRLLHLKELTDRRIKDQFRVSCYYACNMFINERRLLARMLAIDKKNYPAEWLEAEEEEALALHAKVDRESKIDDVNIIYGTLMESIEYSSKNTLPRENEINAFKKKTVSNIEAANFWFLVLYILGSLILGAAFIIRSKKYLTSK
jgi:hypothetical protein